MIALLAIAAQLAVVTAPSRAAICEPVEIKLDIRLPAQTSTTPVVVAPSFAPFEVLRSTPGPSVSRDSDGYAIAEYSYVIATDVAGSLTIPPFTIRLGSAVVQSNAAHITIDGSAAPEGGGVVARAEIGSTFSLDLRHPTAIDTVFVGQQANYEVTVFVTRAVHDQLRRSPTFFPPDVQSMLAYDLPQGSDPPGRIVQSRCFVILGFQRAVFPLAAGRIAVAPAQLVYSIPLSGGVFSLEESHNVETDSAVVVAVEPPAQGRPQSFLGAIGVVRLSARTDTAAARVGVPVTLTMRVSGVGNVKLFPRPALSLDWGKAVRADERVNVDSLAWRVDGSKEFDWVVTPTKDGDQEIPPIRYGYFDPVTRTYGEAVSAPVRLHVAAGTLAGADTADRGSVLALRPRDRGPSWPPFDDSPVFWVVVAAVPVCALAVRARRPGSRTVTARATAPEAVTVVDPAALRRLYASTIARRVAMPEDALSREGGFARALRRAGVPPELAREAEAFLRRLDRAAFGQGELPDSAAERRARELMAQIDAEAIPAHDVRSRRGSWAVAVATAGLLAAAGTGAATFDQGIAAYAHRDYAGSQHAFASVAWSEKRSADAWANYGTAAWAADDTAQAAAGWQRALRLDPLAFDIRDRVSAIQNIPFGTVGYVYPLSGNGTLVSLAVVWIACWSGVAIRPRRLGWLAWTGIAVSVGGIAAAHVSQQRNALDRYVVVRARTSLSSDPALGTERDGAVVETGDVLRVRARSGRWTQLQTISGERGWLDAPSLVELDPARAAAPPD